MNKKLELLENKEVDLKKIDEAFDKLKRKFMEDLIINKAETLYKMEKGEYQLDTLNDLAEILHRCVGGWPRILELKIGLYNPTPYGGCQ